MIDMHGRDAAAEAALVSMLGLPTIEAKHGLVGMTLLSGSNDALSQLKRHDDAVTVRMAVPGSPWAAPVSAASANGNILEI